MNRIFFQLFLFSLTFLIIFSVRTNMASSNIDILSVLILSGKNNHNWEQTTPEIKNILEESGRFRVSITENPNNLNPADLMQYDVILSNWNTWPDVTGKRWKSELEKAFIEFIEGGKGFVVVHAGSSTLQDWPEFQQIAGGTWGKEITGHGPIHTFKVRIEDNEHPVTTGLKDFFIKDELWNRTKFDPDIKVLCSAYSTPDKKGTGKNEPIVVTTKYGKGRGFYSVLGHNKATMQNTAWKTILLRGTEWAATGNVTSPPLEPWPSKYETAEQQSKYWEQSDTTLTLMNGHKIVWQFNFPHIGKPYFHPLNTIDGHTLTWLSPPDHRWHYALWFSWKYINGINYWEEDKITNIPDGLTEVTDSDIKVNNDLSAKINLKISYHPPNVHDLLIENRIININRPDEFGNFNIDWESEFLAGDQDVILERTPIEGQESGRRWGGYATLGLRINSEVLTNISLLNDSGKKGLDIHTTPTKWTDISGIIRDDSRKSAGITIFDHNQNPRHPAPGYVINSENKEWARFVYTNPGFLYKSAYKINAGETLKLRYRIYVHNELGEIENLNQVFNNFINN